MSELDNRDWLDAEIGQLTSYHVGREKWAWIATALFAPALVWFGYAAAPYVADRGRIVAAVLIWFLTSSMLALVNAQFCRAWEAANAVSQLRRVRADLSGAPPEARESLGLLEAPAAGRSGFLRALLSTLTFFWRPKLDRRWRVEVPSYVVIVVAAVVAVVSLWATVDRNNSDQESATPVVRRPERVRFSEAPLFVYILARATPPTDVAPGFRARASGHRSRAGLPHATQHGSPEHTRPCAVLRP